MPRACCHIGMSPIFSVEKGRKIVLRPSILSVFVGYTDICGRLVGETVSAALEEEKDWVCEGGESSLRFEYLSQKVEKLPETMGARP